MESNRRTTEIVAQWLECRDDGIIIAVITQVISNPSGLPIKNGKNIYIYNKTGNYKSLCREKEPGTAFQGFLFCRKKDINGSRRFRYHVLVTNPLNTDDLYIEVNLK